ncbi:MAG TPA: two-component regulator propeller domain-containing protein, partial [Chitinivibrionales bacterium]
MHTIFKQALALILLSVIIQSPAWAIGRSAVITLVFPPGARATGLGEAFTGLADDANATFFNPAGLGQAPLANSWKAFVLPNSPDMTAIASKRKKDFSLKEKIWVGTTAGLLQYDGNAVISYEKYLIGSDETPQRIAKKYISVDNEEILAKAVLRLKEANGIDAKRIKTLTAYLRAETVDSLLRLKKTSMDALTAGILDLPKADRVAPKIYGVISGKVDSLKVNKMADDIAELLKTDDVSFEDMVDLKIPFTIAVSDTVTALCVDSLERLWVGTNHGVWRYDGSTWNLFTVADGLPSNAITAFATGPEGNLAIGTASGAALFSEGKATTVAPDSAFAASRISAIAFGKDGVLYFGTSKGVVVKKDSVWSLLYTAAGLLS